MSSFKSPVFAASSSVPYQSGSPAQEPKDTKPLVPVWARNVAIHSVQLAVSGAVTGALCDIAAHPFYNLSNQVMMQGAKPEGTQYKGVMDGLPGIYRKDGVKGLFRGLPVVLSAAPPAMGLLFMGMFGTQEAYKGSKLESWATRKWGTEASSFAVNFTSGYMGQIFGSLFFVPSSVISETQQAKGFNATFEKLSMSQTIARVYQMGGIRGFYKGFIPQVASFGTCHALSVPGYKKVHKELEALGYIGPLANITSGVLGYAIGSVLTHPLAVAKTRLQVAKINPERFPETNTFSALTGIVKREGVQGLFRGVSARTSFIALRLGVGIPVAGIAQQKLKEIFEPSPSV